MNAKYLAAVLIVFSLGASNVAIAAPFANLDFEAAVAPGDVLPNIPLISLDVAGELVTLGGNIAAFAGTSADLTITTTTPAMDGPELWAWLDNVSFSTAQVPEPGTLTLSLLAAHGLIFHGRRRRATLGNA